RENWSGSVDQVLLLEIPVAGPEVHARMTGAQHGLEGVLGALSDSKVLHVDTQGTTADSFRLISSIAQSLPEGARVLVAATNDPSAVGALQGLECAGRL